MKLNRSCYLLIADGFAEESVSQTIEYFRLNEIEITFLTLFLSQLGKKLLVRYGIASVLIGDADKIPLPEGLLMVGGQQCSNHFLIDPRVYHLVHKMHKAGNPVGFLYPAATILVKTFHDPYLNKLILVQERLQTLNFLHDFARRMPYPFPFYHRESSSLLL